MSSPQHFIGEVGQKALIVCDGKVLMCHNLAKTRWDLPGGRLHNGEAPKEGLVRELKEELGADITVGNPLHTFIYIPSVEPPRFFVVYEATLNTPTQDFVLAPDEIADARWFGRDEYAEIPMPDIWREVLRHYFKE